MFRLTRVFQVANTNMLWSGTSYYPIRIPDLVYQEGMETHYLSSFFFFIDNLNVAKLFLLVSAKCKCIAMSHFLLDKSVYRFHSSRFFSNFCIFVFHFVFIKLWRNFYVAFGGHKYSLLPMLESNIKNKIREAILCSDWQWFFRQLTQLFLGSIWELIFGSRVEFNLICS